ncbi:MAG: GST-like protein [Rhodospirillaceae bacterium]|jgi:GST-like protein|nr:GST-like protein [Rhodospirillaceae bacterium]
MTYELFAAPASGSAVIEAMLDLAGTPFRIVDVIPWQQGADLARLRSVNPLCQVPTLILPDGTVLTESAAMVLHLAEQAPNTRLVPMPGAPSRTAFLRWLMFLVANIYPTFTYSDVPSRLVADPDRQEEVRTRLSEYRKHLWQIVADNVASSWFLETGFSVLDLYVAVMTRWEPRRQWFSERCPKLYRIAEAVEAIPELESWKVRNFA